MLCPTVKLSLLIVNITQQDDVCKKNQIYDSY